MNNYTVWYQLGPYNVRHIAVQAETAQQAADSVRGFYADRDVEAKIVRVTETVERTDWR